MAILKCNMCGGELDLSTDMSVGICQFCGSKITIPKDLDHKGNLYNRAIFLRQNNEFDKAALIYEDILKEDNSDAEAHWGLVLSKFGIEYVANPATGEHHPTCHRTQAESILSDPDYLAAIEYYDIDSALVIKEQAKQINEIQSKILEISRKEAPYDIFICYKETDSLGNRTEDSTIAQELYYELLKRDYKVFFARKTLESKLGSEYEPIIYAALNSAKVMIVLGTTVDNFNAVWVRNEWSRFIKMARDSREEKVIIPAYKGFSPYELPNELSTFQSQNMAKIGFLQDLIDGIERCLRNKRAEDDKKVVNGNSVDMHQRLVKNGETHLRLGNFDAAQSVYSTLVNDYPDDYRGWWGLINCKTMGFTNIHCDINKINVWYKYVNKLATPEEFAELEKTYLTYLRKAVELDVKAETDNILKIIASKKTENANYQKTINSLNQSAVTIKAQYNRQVQTDEFNVAKANENISTDKSRLLRKTICVSAFWGMFLLSFIFLVVGIYMISQNEKGTFIAVAAIVNLLSYINLFIAPTDTFARYKDRIRRSEEFLAESDACREQNAVTYQRALLDNKKKINAVNEKIDVVKKRIDACNNYLNIGKQKIGDYCFYLRCASIGKAVSFDATTQNLRDLAYGKKKSVETKPTINSNIKKTENKEATTSEKTREVECTNCGSKVNVKEGVQDTAYCSVCGGEISLKK